MMCLFRGQKAWFEMGCWGDRRWTVSAWSVRVCSVIEGFGLADLLAWIVRLIDWEVI